MSDATTHRQRHHSSGNNGEVISSNSNNGNWNRGRPTSHEWPRVLQPPQLPPPVAIMRESTPRIHRSRSCGNGSDSDDVKFPYHSPQLPFARSTTSSPNHHNHHPPPSSRGSHHAARSSHLPRENTYSKGINVNNLQPPIRRMLHNNNNQTSSPRSSPVGFGALSLPRPARRSSVCGKSVEDEAISRLRELCMDIVQPSKKGTSPPSRAKIVKEAVVEYHRSRNRPISPRDPNFSAIPSEFSQVLTYGLARSQSVQQSTTFSRKELRDNHDHVDSRTATLSVQETLTSQRSFLNSRKLSSNQLPSPKELNKHQNQVDFRRSKMSGDKSMRRAG